MFFLPLVIWYVMCWPWFSYILAWTGFKPREETHCFHAPVLPHLTLEMLHNRFGEGVAGLCLPTLMHAWLGTWIRLVPSGRLCRLGMRLCLYSAGLHSSTAWECNVRGSAKYVLSLPEFLLTADVGLCLDLQKGELSEFLTSHLIGYKMKNCSSSHTCLYSSNDIWTYKLTEVFDFLIVFLN